MPAIKDTYIMADNHGGHLYIIIGCSGQFYLSVNLTTPKSGRQNDRSCVLNIGDHPFITGESIINYYYPRENLADNIDKNIREGFCIAREPVSEPIFDRILEGAKVSPRFAPKFLMYIQ